MDILDWLVQTAQRIRWIDLLISLGIMGFFLLLRKMLSAYVITFLVKKLNSLERVVKWLEAFDRPLRVFFMLLGAYLAVIYFVTDAWHGHLTLERIFRSGVIFSIGWGIFNLSASSSTLVHDFSTRLGIDESSMVIPFLTKCLRFIIVVLMATIIGEVWGFSINGLVAGLGLGSLAVALAAKETLGNIIGGIIIIVERPFAKGDWIMTPSGEGFVEDITFRSTKIRTFADSVVTMPNANLSNQPITNWSQMGRRRITYTLNVALDTDTARIERAVERIESMLRQSKYIDERMIMVRFSEISEKGLGLFFYFFTKTTVWAEHLSVRQEMNIRVLNILREEGIRVAYPTQRVMVDGDVYAEQSGVVERM